MLVGRGGGGKTQVAQLYLYTNCLGHMATWVLPLINKGHKSKELCHSSGRVMEVLQVASDNCVIVTKSVNCTNLSIKLVFSSASALEILVLVV